MGQTTFQVTGIIQTNHRHWETSAEIVKPSISPKLAGRHGAIVAKIALSEAFTGTAPRANALPSFYVPSAVLTVYSQWPAKEAVVFYGLMPEEPIFRAMAMPPTNEPQRLSEKRFRISVGDPRDSISLKLPPGNYRAEVLFYTQLYEMNSTGHPPMKVEDGGSAINFAVGAFNIAPMLDARGEVKIIGSVTPNKSATPTQIAAMLDSVGREGRRASAEVQAFLTKHSRGVDIGPAKKPWLVNSTVVSLAPPKAPGRPQPGFIQEYFVIDGESYTEQASAVSAELQKVLRTGNLSRKMPGGSIRLQSTTNLKFTPKN